MWSMLQATLQPVLYSDSQVKPRGSDAAACRAKISLVRLVHLRDGWPQLHQALHHSNCALIPQPTPVWLLCGQGQHQPRQLAVLGAAFENLEADLCLHSIQ